ncbi:acyltransferase family protein [Arthrobacter oryzae]|uniref:acyltransferase family protein n=1 Tax=Arthrobacter oryzae TaxID=409290 RepID=UPI00285DC6B1|nr:acyltransferase family protein [Arthrobacter oryzae]MDR6505110.1 peptidoglycan/LPS O-acetylase OafA/YrhL [Arthrobacter oryzae]
MATTLWQKSARNRSARGGRKRPSAAPKAFRPDIQGLRAFAVIVVILDHLVHWPNGGFIGVDVFFVISGFLITGHLMREYDKTGHISFVSFYKKRAKRILPAAVLVVVATVSISAIAFNSSRFQSTAWDGFWALFFGANWRFASTGTDYFQADGPVSPLQHFWSLAVEEQFYFVWPWILLIGFMVFLRGDRKSSYRARHIVAGVAIGVVTSASLAWAIWETQTNAGVAYFSTMSRGWELGIGAGLAVAIPLMHKMPNSIRPWLAWAGTVGLFASLFVISESTAFPAPAALLPTLSAAVLIAANTGHSPHKSLWIFTNRVSGYIGDISYSLYLWHFPVIILGAVLIPGTGPLFYVVVSATILLTSVFAYHLWEDSIRRSGWLSGKKHWVKEITFSEGYKRTALALLAVVTIVTSGVAVMPREAPVSALALANTSSTPKQAIEPTPTAAVAYGPETEALQASIKLALAAETWPELSPSMDEAISSDPYPPGVSGCGTKDWGGIDECTFGAVDGAKSVVLVGDSVAMKWAGSLIPVAEARGWKLTVAAMFGCPFNDAEKSFDSDAKKAECASRIKEVKDHVATTQPDAVLVANTSILPNAAGSATALSLGSWSSGLSTALKTMPAGTAKVIMSAPPADKDIRDCYTPTSTPAKCASSKTTVWQNVSAAEAAVAKEVAGSYVDTSPLFCAQGLCPAFVDTTATKRDLTHITLPYATKIEGALSELIADIIDVP